VGLRRNSVQAKFNGYYYDYTLAAINSGASAGFISAGPVNFNESKLAASEALNSSLSSSYPQSAKNSSTNSSFFKGGSRPTSGMSAEQSSLN
jgi:hypothetical protein